ncbi:MAG TPA: ParB N-terminal domain-containing protein [Aggregatilineales bacterium]|nr:ParB N-terminal domain-containing protein [Aggregatilineales bacterium]
MGFDFSPEEAVRYTVAGRLEEWIHAFLTSAGANIALSEGLKLQKRWWIGPVYCSLSSVQRICGPEENMAYKEPPDSFERRVTTMVKSLQEGWQAPPLIVEYGQDGKMSVRDGSHRHEALVRSGQRVYWAIFWCNSEADFNTFRNDTLGWARPRLSAGRSPLEP